jgi:hypothetical protein
MPRAAVDAAATTLPGSEAGGRDTGNGTRGSDDSGLARRVKRATAAGGQALGNPTCASAADLFFARKETRADENWRMLTHADLMRSLCNLICDGRSSEMALNVNTPFTIAAIRGYCAHIATRTLSTSAFGNFLRLAPLSEGGNMTLSTICDTVKVGRPMSRTRCQSLRSDIGKLPLPGRVITIVPLGPMPVEKKTSSDPKSFNSTDCTAPSEGRSCAAKPPSSP